MRTQSDGSRSIASRLWPAYAELLRWRHRRDEGRFYGMDMSPDVRRDATIDWNDYQRFYVPKGGLKGLQVLDVGAGEGETAKFFIEQGASLVVCVEKDLEKVKRLRINAEHFGWPVRIIPGPFYYTQVYLYGGDFVKVDVEGAESELLELPKIDFRLAVEIHGRELYQKFRTKFPNLRYDRVRWPSELWMARFP